MDSCQKLKLDNTIAVSVKEARWQDTVQVVNLDIKVDC